MSIHLTQRFVLPTVLGWLASTACADWTPRVYCGIKWSAANQGVATLGYTHDHHIPLVPIAYHGGVDTNASGEITPQNTKQFQAWVARFVPSEYCGPVVLDYEQPWWKELRSKTISPNRLAEILSNYTKGVRIARTMRPDAQWGYWGLPAQRHTGSIWRDNGLSLESLLTHCTALFPEVYDCHPGKPRIIQIERHITNTLEQAAGRMPVYVFVSPRYCGNSEDRTKFIPDDIFVRRIDAAMRASWIDDQGTQHKIAGVVLWDAYGYTPKQSWLELDARHKHYFELIDGLVATWKKTMRGIPVWVDHHREHACIDALPTPDDSSKAIFDSAQKNAQPTLNNRVKGNRAPNDAIGRKLPPIH